MDAQNITIDDLKSDFSGTILTESDAGFDQARQLWNAMIDRRPTAIARCRGTAEPCLRRASLAEAPRRI